MGLRVLLVGAGHAHLYAIREARGLRGAGVDLCLVSPSSFSYSGLATGVLSGAVGETAGDLDVAALAADNGVDHHRTTVASVDLGQARARLTDGGVVEFDVVSFNVGSIVADPAALKAAPDVWAVKPLPELVALKGVIERAIAASNRCPALVVAGGGQTAFETAAALCGLCERLGVRPRISLVGSRVDAAWAPARAARRLRAGLSDRGVDIRTGRVVARTPGACQLQTGAVLPCDVLVLATGLMAPSLMTTLDLPVDADHRLKVSPTLQALGDPRVFAVGDCAVLAGSPRPCVGVFGVRAAPILVRNLIALARGRPLTAYRPQRRWLSIMDLGDGTGLALRGSFWALGAAALALKRRLDFDFIRRMRRPASPVRQSV